MPAPRQASGRGGSARPARTGAKPRNKGTAGGRPEPAPVPAQTRRSPGTQTRPGGGAGAAGQRASSGRAQVPGGSQAESAPAAVPAWLRITTFILSIGGLGVSVYLTVAHYTSTAILACSSTGVFNCDLVTTSPESMLFGIFPVAVLGLAFYLFMVAVTAPPAWRSAWPYLRWARLGAVAVGMVFVLYLVYTELITLDHICPWCTSVHVITFILFCLIIFSSVTVSPPAPSPVKR